MTPNKSPKTCSNAYTGRSVYLKKPVMAFKMAYNFFFLISYSSHYNTLPDLGQKAEAILEI